MAVISIIQKIIELYSNQFNLETKIERVKKNGEYYSKEKPKHDLKVVERHLGEFNFNKRRKKLREKYLKL